MQLAEAIFDWEAQPKEIVMECNLCGASAGDTNGFLLEALSDRYGFNQECSRCPGCDLVFLNPRLTSEAYKSFYMTAYRPLVSAFHGREINPYTIQGEQYAYAVKVARFIRQVMPTCRYILDVGGSTGVVAQHIKHAVSAITATVLDPSLNELDMCEPSVERIHSTIEGWNPVLGDRPDRFDPFDLILLCQTVDHLTDIAGTLHKLHWCLSEGGHLFVDILDYNQTRETKVDHPFNLTRETMLAFLSKAGFKVVAQADAANKHVNYLCVKV